MCKLGDIIVIKEFKNEIGEIIKKHSFVVINDEENSIEGMSYDFVCNMLCSFHNEDHKKRKIRYKENLQVIQKDIYSTKVNEKEGYIKVDQLYYFNKTYINYYVFGHVDSELLDDLLQLVLVLSNEGKLKYITTNLIGCER